MRSFDFCVFSEALEVLGFSVFHDSDPAIRWFNQVGRGTIDSIILHTCNVSIMTTKTILVQIRMPEYLIKNIDDLQERGIYTSRTEVILDSVRRLVFAYHTDNPLKIAIARSLHGGKGTGSFRDFASDINPEEIASALQKAFHARSIDEIIDEVRR